MSIIDDDMVSNPSANETFQSVVDARFSRRSLIRGGIATAGAAVAFTGTEALVRSVPVHADGHRHHGYGKGYGQPAGEPLLGFEGVAPSSEDTVIVPTGLSRRRAHRLGRPGLERSRLQAGRQQHRRRTGPAVGHAQRRDRVLPDQRFVEARHHRPEPRIHRRRHAVHRRRRQLECREDRQVPERPRRRHHRGQAPARRMGSRTALPVRTADHSANADRDRRAVGWPRPAQDERRPRRNDSFRHDQQLRHGLHAVGHVSRLRGELQRVLQRPAAVSGTLLARYGISPIAPTGTQWFTTDARFDVAAEPNESNRFGWVWEINPFDPNSTPVKRTALGRLKHEGAWVQEARDGRVVVYMGDDQAFEYIYRYVSGLFFEKYDGAVAYSAHGAWCKWFIDDGWLAETILIGSGKDWWLLAVTDTD